MKKFFCHQACLWWRLSWIMCSIQTAVEDNGKYDFHRPVLLKTVSPHVGWWVAWLSVLVDGTGFAGQHIKRMFPIVIYRPPWWNPTRQALHTVTSQEQPTYRWFLTHRHSSHDFEESSVHRLYRQWTSADDVMQLFTNWQMVGHCDTKHFDWRCACDVQ